MYPIIYTQKNKLIFLGELVEHIKHILFFIILKFACGCLIFYSLLGTKDPISCAIAIDACTERDEYHATQQVMSNALHYQSPIGTALAFCCYALRSITHLENPAALEDKLFAQLDTIPIEQTVPAAYYEGKKLPPLFSAYLAGVIGQKDARERALHHIDQSPTISDKIISKAVAELLFTPEQAAQAIKPRREALELVTRLKEHNPGIPLILTLNFCSLAPVQQKMPPPVVDLFKDPATGTIRALCSGDINHIKTSPDFYHHLGRQFSLDPETTLLIESEPQHTLAAQKAGFTRTILWHDAAQVTQELQQLKLL